MELDGLTGPDFLTESLRPLGPHKGGFPAGPSNRPDRGRTGVTPGRRPQSRPTGEAEGRDRMKITAIENNNPIPGPTFEESFYTRMTKMLQEKNREAGFIKQDLD